MDSVLKRVQVALMRIIKFAGKIIVSDALINDNVFEFLKHRDISSTIFLKNNFQKFKDVPAVRVRDEANFLNKLVEHCTNDKPFLFGCDSCDVATKFYHHCKDAVADPAVKAKFMLITADTNIRIKDASLEMKGKFVFFSPKITFGVDFSVADAQDMFIYIKGNSIQPSGCFQQATRCRNIKTLYYFGECEEDGSRYNSLAEVKHDVEHCLEISRSLNNMCACIDENDEFKLMHNTFFNLYCYNVYVKDVYASNKVRHFELILEQNGFALSSEGVSKALLSKAEKQNMKNVVESISNDLFDEFIASENKMDEKFSSIMKNLAYLKLEFYDVEALTKFREIIQDKYKMKEHDAIIRFLKTGSYIDNQLKELQAQSIDVKLMTNPYHQVKLLKHLENTYGLNIYNLDAKVEDTNFELDEKLFALIKRSFNCTRKKPTTYNTYKQMYVALVKSATGRDIIVSKKCNQKNEDKGIHRHFLNDNLIQTHLELNKYKNKGCKGFSDEAICKFGIKVATQDVDEDCDAFLDDANDLGGCP